MAGAHIFETYNLGDGSKKNRVKKIQRVVMFMSCSFVLMVMVRLKKLSKARSVYLDKILNL